MASKLPKQLDIAHGVTDRPLEHLPDETLRLLVESTKGLEEVSGVVIDSDGQVVVRMNLPVVLAVLIGTLILACSSADVPSADPTPNVNATVDAKLAQERAVDKTVEARANKLVSDQTTPTPIRTLAPTPVLILTPTVTPNSDEAPTIDIMNYSSYATSDIWRWVTLAEAKMKNRSSSILAFIYPVGKFVSELNFEGRHMHQHEMMLSQNEIETILSSVETWFKTRSCLAGERHRDVRDEHLEEYRQWLEGGADASTMQAVCSDTRIVAMGITEHMRNDEPLTEFQNLLIHEHYHAFQQDLEYEGICRSHSELTNANTRWMVEGAAHYFSTSSVEEINGSTEAHSKILELALESYDRNGPGLLDGGESDKTGAAALRLMIEKGMLDEESIMDGSLFHDCARELVFDRTSPEIERIRESWYQIENQGGVYQFKPEALAP